MSDIDEEELGERWKKFKKENWARTSYSNKFTGCEKMTDDFDLNDEIMTFYRAVT